MVFFGFTGSALELGFECKNPHFGVVLGAEGPAEPHEDPDGHRDPSEQSEMGI